MEAIVVKAVVRELGALLPARVQAVLQPSPREIVLSLRGAGSHFLLASAAPDAPRLHLVAGKPPVIPVPTAFCRLLRKHLEGAVLTAAANPGSERVVRLLFSRPGGAQRDLLLVAELMGKHSNLILVEAASGTVVDALQHVEPPMSRVRTVLPGALYTAPPHSGRLDLEAVDAATFAAIHRETGGKHAELLRRFVGLSPGLLLLGEAAAGLDPAGAADPGAALFAALRACRDRVERGDTSPVRYPERKLLLPLPVPGWESAGVGAPTMNQAAEEHYRELLAQREVARRREELGRRLEREVKKVRAEEAMREAEAREAEGAGFLQRAGTALLVAGVALPRGATAFPVEDPVTGGVRDVALDPALGPRQNAERLFHRARKVKRRAAMALEKLPRVAERRRLLEEELALVARLPLDALRERTPGRAPAASSRPAKAVAKGHPAIREYRSADGCRILVGKSGAGNEYLTGRLAAPEDYWFHVRDYPGAHVVLKTAGAAEVPEEAIRAAGEIAAWHSGARAEGMVEVGYTRRKHLRKVKGGAPGRVLIAESATVRVRPRVPAGYAEVKA
jgi:predicted ribosome quality control (RQC) complex YloA/Tae2 family protein